VAYKYLTDCVSANGDDIREMRDAAKSITRKTFLKDVNREQMAELERGLGYEADSRKGLTMANDRAVSYHRSKYKGKPCYYFVWSGIEHIFLPDGNGRVESAYGVKKSNRPMWGGFA
jgi:hypothetical protein